MFSRKVIITAIWLVALFAAFRGFILLAYADRIDGLLSISAYGLLTIGLACFALLSPLMVDEWRVTSPAWMIRVFRWSPVWVAAAFIVLAGWSFYADRRCEMLPESRRCGCYYVFASKPALTPLRQHEREAYLQLVDQFCTAPVAPRPQESQSQQRGFKDLSASLSAE